MHFTCTCALKPFVHMFTQMFVFTQVHVTKLPIAQNTHTHTARSLIEPGTTHSNTYRAEDKFSVFFPPCSFCLAYFIVLELNSGSFMLQRVLSYWKLWNASWTMKVFWSQKLTSEVAEIGSVYSFLGKEGRIWHELQLLQSWFFRSLTKNSFVCTFVSSCTQKPESVNTFASVFRSRLDYTLLLKHHRFFDSHAVCAGATMRHFCLSAGLGGIWASWHASHLSH